MNPRSLIVAFSLFTAMTVPALAGVTVNSPSNDANVSSTFSLSASASTCSSQNVASMGYSFDSSSDTTVIKSQTINQSISGPSGTHTLHVKAWGNSGASCVTDVTVIISAGATTESGDSVVPS